MNSIITVIFIVSIILNIGFTIILLHKNKENPSNTEELENQRLSQEAKALDKTLNN